MNTFTQAEYDEAVRYFNDMGSPNPKLAIAARCAMASFIAEHGMEKCNAIGQAWDTRNPNRALTYMRQETPHVFTVR